MNSGNCFTRGFNGILAAGLVATVASPAFGAEEDSQRPNLTGTVQGEAGKPVSNAVVFIDTAAPKHGPSTLCPSCYADCRKRAVTDAEGQFTIASLDPDLTFRVLVAAGGWQPQFVSKVDPALQPLLITLKPQLGGETPDKKLQGRVVDGDGQPVAGAVINLRGVTRGEGTQFGGNDGVDPVAVSDADGNFAITSRNPFDGAGVDVEARGFAKGIFQNLATGGVHHTLKLTEGATLKGRVVKDGKPLAGVEIDVSGANREASAYVGDFAIATGADGKFLLANLPPHTEYVLCGTMQSLGERGCIPANNVHTGDDGSTSDIGDVEVKPAFVLSGQIRLTDGKPLPAHQHVQLSREKPWDFLQIETDEAGRFRFTGVPPEQVSLTARVPGYRLSPHNVGLNPQMAMDLIGRIVTYKTDLILEFEPGKDRPGDNSDWETLRAMQDEPLRGAEAAASLPGDIKVTGTVVDAETRQPLPAFTVTEGRKNSHNEEISWLLTRQSAHSNGAFTVYLSGRSQTPPAIYVEADGHVPQASGLITTGKTNFVFALNKGTGPSGVVLKPEGDPDTNTTVYLTDMKNGVYVGDQKLAVREEIYRGTRKTHTDAAGRFSFRPQIDGFAIMVVDEAGYAEVPVGQLETNHEVRLQKYARIEGQLLIGSRPGTNESVRLGLAFIPYAYAPRQFPPLSLFLTTRTDANGKFVFERVPPVAVEVYHEPKVRDCRMGTIAQSQTTGFQLQPGETRRLVLGGKGRPVIGRLVVSSYDGDIDYRADVQSIETVVPPPPELPDMTAMAKEFSAKLRSLDNDAARKTALAEYQKQQQANTEKLRAFYQTETGRQYLFARRRFALNFSQDGAFRIEDVPGGKYDLRIELRETGPNQFSTPPIASLVKEIVVPDSPGGRSGEPFDLGALEMTARNGLKVGKAAPDFAVKTLDGKPLKLSDFKGKYLLLDFWATWCGPCVAETPYLKATWETFKKDQRFAMAGLSLDPEVDAPRNYAAKNGIGWTQGFLGEWSKSDVPERFGVQGIPAIFLIGPDGKIVAKDLRGEAIKSAVQVALQKN